jgi:hypothetical protein
VSDILGTGKKKMVRSPTVETGTKKRRKIDARSRNRNRRRNCDNHTDSG